MYKNSRLKHVKKIKSLLVGMDGVGKEHVFPLILDQCNLLLAKKKKKSLLPFDKEVMDMLDGLTIIVRK